MFDLISLIFPAVQACLEGIALSDTHTIDLGSYSIRLIFGNSVRATVYIKSRF
jgi:hypothetical protein